MKLLSHAKATVLCCLLLCYAPAALAKIAVQEVSGGGVTAWLVEDHHIPAFTIMIAFRDAGYASDTPQFAGRAPILADMLMEGTQRMDDQAFHIALDSHAIDLGVESSRDMLAFNMTSLTENTDTAFSLLSDAMLRPRFDPARLREAQAQALMTLKRMDESPEYRLGQTWNQQVYGSHPYANPPMGTVGGIKAITPEELERLRRTHLTKENVIISVVGAMDADRLEDLLDTHFSDLPEIFEPDVTIPDIAIAATGSTRQVTMDVPQRFILIGTQGLTRHDPDFYPAYVMNHILGGESMTSRLGDVVRKKNGFTYNIASALDIDLHSQSFKVMFATRQEQASQAVEATHTTISEFTTKGVTEAEVARAIGYITGSFPLNIDDNSSIANYLIAMQLYDLGTDYLDRRNELFRDVTLEEVNEAAQRLLKPGQFYQIEVGPASR